MRKVLDLSLYLNFSLTYWLAGGDDIVNELYGLSRHNNLLEPAMTGCKLSNNFSVNCLRFVIFHPAALGL